MKSKFFMFALFICALMNPAYSQSQKLPLSEDLFLDFAPRGFVHKFEQQNFKQVLIEFLPKDETLENWSQMLSLTGMPVAEKVPDLSKYIDFFFSGFSNTCKKIDVVPVSYEENEALMDVSCIAKDQAQIPGGKNLQWENGVYRFIKTKKMIFQIHFVSHGEELPTNSENNQYMDQARSAVENVVICNLAADIPCPPLDQYTSQEDLPVPAVGSPPCREEGFDCFPTAMIEVKTADNIEIDEMKKIGFLTLDFSKIDIQEPNVLRNYLGNIATSL